MIFSASPGRRGVRSAGGGLLRPAAELPADGLADAPWGPAARPWASAGAIGGAVSDCPVSEPPGEWLALGRDVKSAEATGSAALAAIGAAVAGEASLADAPFSPVPAVVDPTTPIGGFSEACSAKRLPGSSCGTLGALGVLGPALPSVVEFVGVADGLCGLGERPLVASRGWQPSAAQRISAPVFMAAAHRRVEHRMMPALKRRSRKSVSRSRAAVRRGADRAGCMALGRVFRRALAIVPQRRRRKVAKQGTWAGGREPPLRCENDTLPVEIVAFSLPSPLRSLPARWAAPSLAACSSSCAFCGLELLMTDFSCGASGSPASQSSGTFERGLDAASDNHDFRLVSSDGGASSAPTSSIAGATAGELGPARRIWRGGLGSGHRSAHALSRPDAADGGAGRPRANVVDS